MFGILRALLERERESLMFSNFNRRIGEMNLSHIDRMYVSDALSNCGGMTSFVAGSCMSNHAPVVVSFKERDYHGSPITCIPESIQLDENLALHIGKIWGQLQWDAGTKA